MFVLSNSVFPLLDQVHAGGGGWGVGVGGFGEGFGEGGGERLDCEGCW